jgi:hypothetical protein
MGHLHRGSRSENEPGNTVNRLYKLNKIGLPNSTRNGGLLGVNQAKERQLIKGREQSHTKRLSTSGARKCIGISSCTFSTVYMQLQYGEGLLRYWYREPRTSNVKRHLPIFAGSSLAENVVTTADCRSMRFCISCLKMRHGPASEG